MFVSIHRRYPAFKSVFISEMTDVAVPRSSGKS